MMKEDLLGLNHWLSLSATCHTVRPRSSALSFGHLRMAPPKSSSAMPKCFRYHAASAAWSPLLLKKTPPTPVIFAIVALLAVKRQPDLTQVMLIMSGDVVEFSPQCAHAVYAVHKLEVATPLVVHARIVDDRVPHGFVHATGEVQGQLRIVESLRPRVLIHHPDHRTRLTERATDPIERDGLVIGEVMQDIRDGPFAWAVGAREVALVER